MAEGRARERAGLWRWAALADALVVALFLVALRPDAVASTNGRQETVVGWAVLGVLIAAGPAIVLSVLAIRSSEGHNNMSKTLMIVGLLAVIALGLLMAYFVAYMYSL